MVVNESMKHELSEGVLVHPESWQDHPSPFGVDGFRAPPGGLGALRPPLFLFFPPLLSSGPQPKWGGKRLQVGMNENH